MDHNPSSITVGSIIVGRFSDYIVIKCRRERKGIWYPEDRLRAAVIPFAVLVPLSVVSYGLVNRFVDGNVGLVISLVCLFFNGGGVSGTSVAHQILQTTQINDFLHFKVDMTYATCVAYLVDVMQSRSSEVLAAIKFVLFRFIGRFRILGFNELLDSVMRSVQVAMTVAVILPMIHAYGIAVSYTLCAVLIWISCGYVIVPEKKKKKRNGFVC